MKFANNVLPSNYVDPKELPWVPTGLGGMETKLCKVNPITGQYIVLTKSPGGGPRRACPPSSWPNNCLYYSR